MNNIYKDIFNRNSQQFVVNTSAGVSTNMAQMGMQAVGAALSALGKVGKNTSSTTHSAIGNNIQLEVKEGNVPAELSRDVANSNEKVTVYTQADIAKHNENQEIANLAAQVGARLVGDISQHFDWKDGSPQKVILHGVVGLISAELSGGNNVAGTAAGVTSEYLNTKVADYLSEKVKNGELTNEERQAIQQATAAGMGAMVGSLIGGNRQCEWRYGKYRRHN